MIQTLQPVYKRILLKLSGEALMGTTEFGIDPAVLDRLAKEVFELVQLGLEIGIVIGGGNLFRGKALSEAGLGRVTGDYMGMLATIMNGLAFRDALERMNLSAQLMSAIPMSGVAQPFNQREAISYLHEQQIVIFTAGTGNPFFTTDSAACLRAIEVNADIVLKATKVDGVYSADPVKYPDATLYRHLTYEEVLHKNLQVMDFTAICLCREYKMPLCVFNMNTPGALKSVILGKEEGTLIGDNNL